MEIYKSNHSYSNSQLLYCEEDSNYLGNTISVESTNF